MKFKSENPVVLVSIRETQSKKGNPLFIAKFADPLTYESVEYLVPSSAVETIEGNPRDTQYILNLESDGRFTTAYPEVI